MIARSDQALLVWQQRAISHCSECPIKPRERMQPVNSFSAAFVENASYLRGAGYSRTDFRAIAALRFSSGPSQQSFTLLCYTLPRTREKQKPGKIVAVLA